MCANTWSPCWDLGAPQGLGAHGRLSTCPLSPLIFTPTPPISSLHLWLPLPADSVSWLPSAPSELEQAQAHLIQLSALPAPAHQRLHIATHQESGDDQEDEGGRKEEAEGHTSGSERHGCGSRLPWTGLVPTHTLGPA